MKYISYIKISYIKMMNAWLYKKLLQKFFEKEIDERVQYYLLDWITENHWIKRGLAIIIL